MLTDAHTHRPPPDMSGLRAVLNGTHPGDWSDVARAASQAPSLIPSYGLHPWRVGRAPADWPDTWRGFLTQHGAVGEIGLDLWMGDPQRERQQEAFLTQWRGAVELNRPVSVHCLKAWNWLRELLDREPIPQAGWMLHAYGGDWGQAKALLDKGAFFSFHSWMMKPKKAFVREAFRKIPADRILVETDAPADGDFDYAASLLGAYEALKELRGEDMRHRVARNFTTLFGQP